MITITIQKGYKLDLNFFTQTQAFIAVGAAIIFIIAVLIREGGIKER